MRRFWLGMVLLAVLLVLGVLETAHAARLTQPIAEQLSRASQASLEGDWTLAGQLTEEAAESWKSHWKFLASVNDHGPMEEIDSQFARAYALLESRATVEFSACCARIAELVRALGDAHAVNLENLL